MSEFGDLLSGITAALWVALALFVFLVLRRPIYERVSHMTKLGLGPVNMEFAEQKLDEAVSKSDKKAGRKTGEVAKRTVLARMRRDADLLANARILWVDDHPEGNTSLIELLQEFDARVDTPRSNVDALALLRSARYDVIISDVGRDEEGPNSDLKGIELAESVFADFGQTVILFTLRFDPTQLPGATAGEKLEVARRVDRSVFGRTNRYDEALHLILDMIERQKV